MNIKDIKKGALILVRPDYGRAPVEVVRVTFIDSSSSMVLYTEDTKKERWAYISQIDGLAV